MRREIGRVKKATANIDDGKTKPQLWNNSSASTDTRQHAPRLRAMRQATHKKLEAANERAKHNNQIIDTKTQSLPTPQDGEDEPTTIANKLKEVGHRNKKTRLRRGNTTISISRQYMANDVLIRAEKTNDKIQKPNWHASTRTGQRNQQLISTIAKPNDNYGKTSSLKRNAKATDKQRLRTYA